MSESGKNIVEGFRVLRTFCKDVSLLLKTANGLMDEAGWERISKRTPAVEIDGSIDEPENWLPEAFFCYYQHAKFPSLLPYIAVHVDDWTNDPSRVIEPLISAGWADYVGTKVEKEWDKDYSVCYSHLLVEDGMATDDGTLYRGDARVIWDDEDTRAGAIALTTFAHPLGGITDSDTLKQKIVKPLLDALKSVVLSKG